VFVSATRNGRHPIGTLTSTAGTFINAAGTTTEYMTQHVGTYIDDKYARIESTATREYYRVALDDDNDGVVVEPTRAAEPFIGLVDSSTSYEVHGRQTTEHTVHHYRTFIDGHYAHLVSSMSKVFSDPPLISATPVYSPDGRGRLRPDQDGQKRLYSDYVFPREEISPSRRTTDEDVVTRTIGHKLFPVKSPQALKLEKLLEQDRRTLGEEEELNENAIRARSIDLDGADRDIEASPVESKSESLPTFTVSHDGRLNIPTPSLDARDEALNEVEPTVQHRFEPPQQAVDRTSMDSVTFLGFVDFTTTIDDTVIIFRPKKTFSTETRNVLFPKITPTSSASFSRPSVVPDEEASAVETSEPERYRTSVPDLESATTTSAVADEDEEIPTVTSGINPLKSLLAASSRRNIFAKPSQSIGGGNTRPRITLRPNPSLGIRATRPAEASNRLVRPTGLARPGQQEDKDEASTTIDPSDLFGSIENNSDVELVYKTLYTTYTYFTTFFRASTTRVKSREEIISNIVTLTNILDPSDLESLRSSCEVDATCQFASSGAEISQTAFTEGFIGRPNSRVIEETPRTSGTGEDIEIDVDEVEKYSFDDDSNAILKTFYTTYTYFTTLFVDGTSSISTRTEVYSNIKSSGVPVSIFSTDSVSLLSTASPQLQASLSQDEPEAPNSRRLEYSSIARGITLQAEITTPEADSEEETTTSDSFVVFGVTASEQEDEESVATSTEDVTTTVEREESSTDYTTTTANEELAESTTTASPEEQTESLNGSLDEEAISPDSVMKTFYTTFTYFTTLFRNGTSYITSNLETVTNTAAASDAPSVVQPSVTFYTTFTYWTTSIDGDQTIVKSSEETRTDVLPASVTEDLNISPSSTLASSVRFTERPRVESIESLNEEYQESLGAEIESSKIEPTSVQIADTTPSLESSAESFDDLDDDFTLTSTEEAESSTSESSSAQRTFTPVIRPNLFRRTKANLRPRGRSTSTTVAIITRSDVTPTLIATPASIPASPSFGPSSSLRSLGPLNRARGRFSSSSAIRGSISSSSIYPSSVASEIVPSSTEAEDQNVPSIIKNLSLRRPSPFRARLRERQRQKLEELRSQANEEEDQEESALNEEPVEQEAETTTRGSLRSRFSRNRFSPSSPRNPPTLSIKKETDEENIEETLSAQERLRLQRERAQTRFDSLFKRRRRPSFFRAGPGSQDNENEQVDPLVVQESRRRKRQVGTYGEFGARTQKRQAYLSRRRLSPSSRYKPSSQSSDESEDNNLDEPSSYDQSPNTNPYSSSIYDNYSLSSTTSWDNPAKSNRNVRRQVESDRTQVTRSRSRSRFNPDAGRTRLRTRPSRIRPEPVTQAPTTPPRQNLRTRFRPRTIVQPQQERPPVNRFTNTNVNNRFGSQSIRRPSSPIKSNLFDYDYYEDYDANVEIQSSQNSVPEAITVTHQVPVRTVIPVRENGRDQFRDILTNSPSLEVIAATALKSTDVDGKPVIYANAQTNSPTPGTKVITFEALRATETTTIVFTPTRIRGLRTSFSHIVPHTIYNIQPVTTEIAEPVDQNQLLSQLLLSLLAGQPLDPLKANNNPLAKANPLLPQLGLNNQPVIQTTEPPTRFVTHTNTFVTTVTDTASTVLPITLRGREIKTTVIESSTKVVTATEYSTETIIAPQAAVAPTLPVLAQSPLQTAVPDLQQQLLQAQLQQQLLNQQILSQVNLDPQQQPQQPVPQEQATQAPAPPKEPPAPSTSVVTKFVSGKNPGEFSIVTSTVTVSVDSNDDDSEKRRRRRDAFGPTPVQPVQVTALPDTVPDVSDLLDSSLTASSWSNSLTREANAPSFSNRLSVKSNEHSLDNSFDLFSEFDQMTNSELLELESGLADIATLYQTVPHQNALPTRRLKETSILQR
jgi:hypothetical protein